MGHTSGASLSVELSLRGILMILLGAYIALEGPHACLLSIPIAVSLMYPVDALYIEEGVFEAKMKILENRMAQVEGNTRALAVVHDGDIVAANESTKMHGHLLKTQKAVVDKLTSEVHDANETLAMVQFDIFKLIKEFFKMKDMVSELANITSVKSAQVPEVVESADGIKFGKWVRLGLILVATVIGAIAFGVGLMLLFKYVSMRIYRLKLARLDHESGDHFQLRYRQMQNGKTESNITLHSEEFPPPDCARGEKAKGEPKGGARFDCTK